MNPSELKKKYEAGKSIRDLCKEYDSYPSQIQNLLKRAGTKMRTKAQAQSLNIKTGKVSHPTKGTKRTHKTKLQISQKLHEQWGDMPNEEKMRRAGVSKENWDSRTIEQKEEFMTSAHKAIREAADNGSKMEHWLVSEINKAGFSALHHKGRMLSNVKLEVDILVSDIKTVIEVDGPSHQEPIWGEESFARRQKSDLEKNGLLLKKGYVIIRFKFNNSKMSLFQKTEARNKLIAKLNEIKTKFPKQENRYVEIFV